MLWTLCESVNGIDVNKDLTHTVTTTRTKPSRTVGKSYKDKDKDLTYKENNNVKDLLDKKLIRR